MELAQMYIIKHILETGSLSETAKRLDKSLSLVSRHLSAFEVECGGRIFYRNGRGVVLTELGERIMPLVEKMVFAGEGIRKCGQEFRDELVGEVRLSVGPQIADLLSRPLYTKLKQTHPKIQLSVWEANWRFRADLKDGRTDIVVCGRTHYNNPDEGFPHRENDILVAELDTYLVGLPDSVAIFGETVRFAELAALPLILPSPGNPRRQAIDQFAKEQNLQLTTVAEANAYGPIAAMVYAGMGYYIAPLFTGVAATKAGWIGADVHAGRLRASRIVEPGLVSRIIVCRGDHPDKSVDAVIRMIVSLFEELLGADLPGKVTGGPGEFAGPLQTQN